MCKKLLFSFFFVLVLGFYHNAIAYQKWDVKADWSDMNNPSGPWSYGGGTKNSFSMLGHINSWLSPGDFPPGQPAWAVSSSGVPGIAKCVTDNPNGKDMLTGDVFGHAEFHVRWISPISGKIRIYGDAWMIRNIGRTDEVWIYTHGTEAASPPEGRLYVGQLQSGVHNRDNRLTFSYVIDVETGQSVDLWIGGNDFTAFNFTIDDNPLYVYQDEIVKIFPPNANPSVSNVMLPDGTWAEFASPTTTGGIQEALDIAAYSDLDVVIFGEEIFDVSTTITVPSTQNFFIDLSPAVINWAGPPNMDMFVIDSAINCRYVIGTLVYNGTAAALVMRPEIPTPTDHSVNIADTEIRVLSVKQAAGRTGDGVVFDTINGVIGWNRFVFMDVSGFNRNIVSGTSNSLAYNNISVGHSHNAGTYHLHDPVNSHDNNWFISIDGQWVSGVKGISTGSTRNMYDISVVNIPVSGDSLIVEAGARKNVIFPRELSGYTNNAAVKDSIILGYPLHQTEAIAVGASPFEYENTSLETEMVTIEGGAVSVVKMSADGLTYYKSGSTSGTFTLLPGMGLEVTYSSPPNMRKYK